jgi:hypothetical protein
MRYKITQTQLHNLVYKYLDDMFEGMTPNTKINPYNSSAYEMRLGEKISYFYYGPGEYDDDTKHYGIGYLHVHPDIVDTLRQLFNIRETKVVDIVADWFSNKFEVDIDEISIYPKREKPPVY